MPKHIKDIERPGQRSSFQHFEFFNQMRLRAKRRQRQQDCDDDQTCGRNFIDPLHGKYLEKAVTVIKPHNRRGSNFTTPPPTKNPNTCGEALSFSLVCDKLIKSTERLGGVNHGRSAPHIDGHTQGLEDFLTAGP